VSVVISGLDFGEFGNENLLTQANLNDLCLC
jgi:hypothetical protein